MTPDLSTGSRLAGYRIEVPVGRGGMGIVYRAIQVQLNRPVALKLIAPELADDESFRERFKRESELAASIDHPNVIPIFEAGEADGQLFIAMRYVEGIDLRTMLAREGPLPPRRAVRIVNQLAAALDSAHQRGLVHRDVKPANVLLTQDREEHVYLTDFGLTKRTGSESALTQTGAIVGTIDYVAPEQIEGRGTDARTDVYALGCVLYHVLAGQVPFPREAEVARMYAHLNEPPPHASEGNAAIPAQLDEVIARGMAKDPAQRYPSAGDLALAAQAALTGHTPEQPEHSVAAGTAAPGAQEAATQAADEPAAATTQLAATRQDEPAGPTTHVAAPREDAPADTTRLVGAPQETRRKRSGPLLLIAGLIALAIPIVLVLALDEGGGGGGGGGGEEPPGEPTTIANVGKGPDGITVDGNDVWVTLANEDKIRRIDAGTRKPAGEALPVGDNPDSIAVDGDSIWVTNQNDRTLRHLTRTGSDVDPGAPITVGSAPEGLAIGEEVVWVANSRGHTVQAVSKATDQLVGAAVPVANQPLEVALDSSYVWVASAGGVVTRIDPGGPSKYDELDVGGQLRGLAIGGGRVWVSDTLNDDVIELDPSGEVRRRIKVRGDPRKLAYGFGCVWVVNSEADNVTRIDASKGTVVDEPIPVGQHPIGIAVGEKAVWVGNFLGNSVTQIPARECGG